ncbi:MAG TPA: type 4a pilus biogenesis protein PilO [Candidatus Paceibacterota bacterium]
MKSLTPFFVIVVCVGMYFVYIKDELVTISEKKSKYGEYQSVLNTVKDTKTLKDTLSSAYTSISPADLEKLEKMIPSRFDSILFANDLNTLSIKNGLKMDRVKTDYKNPESTGIEEVQVGNGIYKTITVNFHVVGTYDSLISFLKDLEISLRLIDVVNITIVPASSDKKTSNFVIDYEIEAKTYSLK